MARGQLLASRQREAPISAAAPANRDRQVLESNCVSRSRHDASIRHRSTGIPPRAELEAMMANPSLTQRSACMARRLAEGESLSRRGEPLAKWVAPPPPPDRRRSEHRGSSGPSFSTIRIFVLNCPRTKRSSVWCDPAPLTCRRPQSGHFGASCSFRSSTLIAF